MLLTPEEIPQYLDQLYNRLLEHRYRYYILADPVLDDWLYDWIEKHYNAMANETGVKPMDMVDFDIDSPGAKEAAHRVDNNQDYHSLWVAEMQPVWERLGRPHYKLQEDKDES